MSSIEPTEEPVGQRAAGLYREVLQQPDAIVGPGDDFFALGGTSLQAMALVQRVEEEFGVSLGLGDLLEDSTLASVTQAIEAGLASSLEDDRR